jgi:hypothetical protein
LGKEAVAVVRGVLVVGQSLFGILLLPVATPLFVGVVFQIQVYILFAATSQGTHMAG